MQMAPLATQPFNHQQTHAEPPSSRVSLLKFMDLLGITDVSSGPWIDKLPFTPQDVTAGTENELQVAVAGKRGDVDLARTIEGSNYFKNIVTRVASGDAPKKILTELENYLGASEALWENSWVRLPVAALNLFAEKVLENDLLADKQQCGGPRRDDCHRFFEKNGGRRYLRIPVSYLLKLALAQAVGRPDTPAQLKAAAERMMGHFLNDNTSPETHAFFPVGMQRSGLGAATAGEILLRYLLTQLLVQYANSVFELAAGGQRVLVYFAPHPPVRQKQLNDLISDGFYRELFMSPCLSGWDQGEAKHRYMMLCHKVLSRSQLNTLAKLKEAGIIANNLVVLPRVSNICLANNGTHVSLGSRTLSRIMADPNRVASESAEKFFGDLVIKICEHFLPLFVGTYTAAPYRIDFSDFHPERALGFLPHELDYTHLRMIWRRWKRKADIKCFGHPLTPFGPEWLDRAISKILGLRGDFVADYRLIDYLAAVLSTDKSPCLDGRPDNDTRLKADLSDMGIFDRRMPLYMLLRLRQYRRMGFSGFEARHYSLFEKGSDMAAAVDLQHLITLLAYKYILQRHISHADIPDTPTVESERRQFFFGAAIGIPTCYVHKKTGNRFLLKIIKLCRHTRNSRRYPGYIRVPLIEYQRAAIGLIYRDGPELIEMLNLAPRVRDLEQRINCPAEHAVAQRMTARITGMRRVKPLRMRSKEFNQAAEAFYRQDLRKEHIDEAYAIFRETVDEVDAMTSWRQGDYNQSLMHILNGRSAGGFLDAARQDLLSETLPAATCEKLIHLLLLTLIAYRQQNTCNPE